MSKSKELVHTLKKAYADYALDIITDRSIPMLVDGLKPVYRRILYNMWKDGITYGTKYKKSAHIVGSVIAHWHPHGDTPVYEAVVKAVQDFNMRMPLIDGQGNFGSIDGDPAAAMRYTEVKGTKYMDEFFKDFIPGVTPMQLNYDGSLYEPKILPTRVPNLLINGSVGIAVGISTSFPPHNLYEVVWGLIHVLKNPDASIDDILKIIKGPDFPTGAVICNGNAIKEAYETGEGSVIIRSPYSLEEDWIIFHEIPYHIQKNELLKRMAEAVQDGRINGISNVRDESGKDGMRIAVKVKNGFEPEIIVNQLYEYTPLRSSYKLCFFALDNNRMPKIFNIKEILVSFLDFRKNIVILRTKHELQKYKQRAHIVIGLVVALENIDQVVTIIKSSESKDMAKDKLSEFHWRCQQLNAYLASVGLDKTDTYNLSEEQVLSILELKLSSLMRLEHNKLINELNDLRIKMERCCDILCSETLRNEIIEEEFNELLKYYSSPRRTAIENDYSKNEKDLITPEDTMIILDHEQYIKRIAVANYKLQNRGGKGKIGARNVATNVIANTHDILLFFTNLGLVYRLDVYEIPVGDHNTKGRALINILDLKPQELVIEFLVISEEQYKNYHDLSILFVLSNGMVRKSSLEQFISVRANGKKYMSFENDCNLVSVLLAKTNDYLFIATRLGKAVCTSIESFRTIGSRDSNGVRGCTLTAEDKIVSAIILKSEHDLIFTITSNGYGKISTLKAYRITNRGSKGVINMKYNTVNGHVIDVLKVHADDNVIVMTNKGQVIRCPMEQIRVTSRNVLGVRIFNIDKNDYVVSVEAINDHESPKTLTNLAEESMINSEPLE